MTTVTEGLAISGRVLTPDHPEYDDQRSLFNAMIDRRPAVIAQCQSSTDVAAAIRYARDHGLEIAVRGGGHSVAGTSTLDDGLVIDLRQMNGVVVDPAARTATVSGGATMSHLDRALEPHGLATTGGRVSTTGVGGFTLGGGTGWLDRKFGLACDNLISARLVTADGSIVSASADENPELFWALHGGGGNFGVATELTFRAYELPAMSAALQIWTMDRTEEAVRTFRDLIENGPDDLGGGVLYLTAPEEEFIPAELVGHLVALVLVTWTGPSEQLTEALRPLSALGPASEVVMDLPYAELQCMLDDPPGNRNYWSAEHLASFPDEAVAAFHESGLGLLVPSSSQHVLFPGGGAAARSTLDTPISWRTAPWTAHPFGVWADPADDDYSRAWVRSVRDAVQPWATGDVYLNFVGDEGPDRIRAGYAPGTWDRLVAVKREFDPDNVFRRNHNIPPA